MFTSASHWVLHSEPDESRAQLPTPISIYLCSPIPDFPFRLFVPCSRVKCYMHFYIFHKYSVSSLGNLFLCLFSGSLPLPHRTGQVWQSYRRTHKIVVSCILVFSIALFILLLHFRNDSIFYKTLNMYSLNTVDFSFLHFINSNPKKMFSNSSTSFN